MRIKALHVDGTIPAAAGQLGDGVRVVTIRLVDLHSYRRVHMARMDAGDWQSHRSQ